MLMVEMCLGDLVLIHFVKKMSSTSVCSEPGGVAPFVNVLVNLESDKQEDKVSSSPGLSLPLCKIRKQCKGKYERMFKCRKPKTKPWLLWFGS